MTTMKTAPSFIRKREYFTAGNLSGGYPYKDSTNGHMVYIIKSYAQPIAVFDGDTWHILDSGFISMVTSRHLNLVRRTLGNADAYSEFPVVPTLASMGALIERLTK